MLQLEEFYASTDGNPLTDAFDKRIGHMPGASALPVPQEHMRIRWKALTQKERIGPSVMYLHVPFCANHCLFCGFYINKWDRTLSKTYTDALISELRLEADGKHAQSAPINAVYFGGGTPTALEADDLARIIREIRGLYPLAPDCEITIEGRIYHFDEEKITACLEAGANRFSIGVQSFDDKTRRRMGRKVSGERAVEFFHQLTSRNQAAVVCDLMLGLPYQDDQIWRRDLETVASLELDGVDLYALSVFPGTPLDLAVKKGACESAADLPRQAAMYGEGWKTLRELGWRQLSSSHWGASTRERNLYNRLIKSGAHTLAFGSGAGGTLNGQSYSLDRNLKTYYEKLADGQKPMARLTEVNKFAPVNNAIAAAIERMRVDLAKIEESHPAGDGYSKYIQPLLDNWRQVGLITSNNQAELTMAGCFWHSTLLMAMKTAFRSYLAKQAIAV
ncbi:heme anaerobic degradation radical SAM methyltransferase ChuW/HutW [Polycladidibacter hongkongensis]|uniref:heme anaerobic degradation radical SAM methyltransferase ChuW/HutW n=1 Tax=Polycladidibacter hongkongensis TaxID=1647556 RepID=UPI0008328546|nr:heme anaerobic degradation radical SAM methyltransferase ChuW/HutW [Pseudovibrio hongkongensis]